MQTLEHQELVLNRIKMNKKRSRIILSIKLVLWVIVLLLYFLVWKIGLLLVNKNVFEENKDFFFEINKLKEISISLKDMEAEMQDWWLNIVQRHKLKKDIELVKKDEEIKVRKIQDRIEEDVFAYGFLCNNLQKKTSDAYETYFKEKCNEEWFKYIMTKKIFWVDMDAVE